MKIVVQRVNKASVTIDGKIIASIGSGVLVLLAVHKDDSSKDCERLAQKLCNLRIFSGSSSKMDLSLKDCEREVLLVPQFTLYADCSKGCRPAFFDSAPPEVARPLVLLFCDRLRLEGLKVKEGVFGAHMVVALENDGPVTIIIDSKK